jgi:hypothetical protein
MGTLPDQFFPRCADLVGDLPGCTYPVNSSTTAGAVILVHDKVGLHRQLVLPSSAPCDITFLAGVTHEHDLCVCSD